MHLNDELLESFAVAGEYIAESGKGTNICLKHGFLPVRVHFYQPIPDIEDLKRRNIWEKRSKLSGIKFDVEEQIDFVKKLRTKFGSECSWPKESTGDSSNFHWKNNSFGFYCASSTHYMIRNYKPKRIIEVGSGMSSLIISDALSKNNDESGEIADYTIIDPYPRLDLSFKYNGLKFIKERVELTDVKAFQTLEENDILFIDSSHTVKTGGDVNFLILDVLPNLKPGVIIHFHDILLPKEYTRDYFENESFRVFWTEAYLLQAFLCFNSEFEVLFGMVGIHDYLQSNPAINITDLFPNATPDMIGSGSIWLNRKIIEKTNEK